VNIEGVEYERFRVYYTVLEVGISKRRRMVRWAPGFPWVYTEIARELVDRFGLDNIKPGSVTIDYAPRKTRRAASGKGCSPPAPAAPNKEEVPRG